MTRFGLLRHAQTTWNATKRIQGQTDTQLTAEGEAAARLWGNALQHAPLVGCCSANTSELCNATPNRPDNSSANNTVHTLAHQAFEQFVVGQHNVRARDGQNYTAVACNGSWQRILCSPLDRAIRTAELINETLRIPLHTDAKLIEQDWGRWTGRTIQELRHDERGEVERQEAAGWHFTPAGGESRIAVRDRVLAALHRAESRWPDERILVVTHLGCIKCVICHALGLTFLPDEPSPVEKHGLHIADMTNGKFSIVSLNTTLVYTDSCL